MYSFKEPCGDFDSSEMIRFLVRLFDSDILWLPLFYNETKGVKSLSFTTCPAIGRHSQVFRLARMMGFEPTSRDPKSRVSSALDAKIDGAKSSSVVFVTPTPRRCGGCRIRTYIPSL